MYAKYLKRVFDVIGASILILILLPVYVILAILIRIKMGTPVLFKQERPGLNEKNFMLMKFRSMNSKTDANGNLLPDMKRLTPFGKLLRKTSLDELPQFFNVLIGDMSFIGPRPLLPRYLPFYTKEEHLRHSVRPGITGLAQINGRNAINWDDKLAFDVKYANNVTFFGDVKICILTIVKVLKGSGVLDPNGTFFDEYRKLQISRKENENRTKQSR